MLRIVGKNCHRMSQNVYSVRCKGWDYWLHWQCQPLVIGEAIVTHLSIWWQLSLTTVSPMKVNKSRDSRLRCLLQMTSIVRLGKTIDSSNIYYTKSLRSFKLASSSGQLRAGTDSECFGSQGVFNKQVMLLNERNVLHNLNDANDRNASKPAFKSSKCSWHCTRFFIRGESINLLMHSTHSNVYNGICNRQWLRSTTHTLLSMLCRLIFTFGRICRLPRQTINTYCNY